MRARAVLARYGWLIAIAAAYLYVFPYFPSIHSANELPRVYLARAIVDDHTFAIDTGVKRWGSTGDVSGYAHHKYSNKSPGSSLLAVPALAVTRVLVGDPSLTTSVWVCRVFAGILPALAFLWLLWGYLARFAPDPDVRRLVVIAYALGSIAMTYTILFYSHQLSAVCIGSAWILAHDVVDRKRGLVAMGVAGALAGCAPLVDYQAAFAGIPVAVWVVVRMWRWPRAEMLRAIGAAAAGAAGPIALLLAYHTACFGSPWRTGYAVSETYAGYHQQGFLGMTYPHAAAIVNTTVSVDNGLFALAPWLLLAIPGFRTLWRGGERGVAAVGASVGVMFLLFGWSLTFWRAGWEVGPRYITVMVPFLLPAIAAQLQAWRARPNALGVAAGAIVVGVAIYALTSATFPYWPAQPTSSAPFPNPLYEVTLRLVGDGLCAPNLAAALGVTGLAGLLPYVALVGGLVGFAIARVAGMRGLAMAVAIAAAVIGAYGLVPRGGVAAEQAYTTVVRPAVADPWAAQP